MITAVVAIGEGVGQFGALEGFLLDERMRHGHWFSPPVSDDIVHVDIDDSALEEVGEWPWKREKVAMVIDALRKAGAKTVVLDVLFLGPQDRRFERNERGEFYIVEDDRILGEAIERMGGVFVGTNVRGAEARDVELAEARGESLEVGDRVVERPIAPVFETAAGTGVVNPGESSGYIRNVKIAETVGGERLLQLGLVGVAHFLGLGADDIEVTEDRCVVGGREFALTDGRAIVPWRPRVRSKSDEDKLWFTMHGHVSIKGLVKLEMTRRQLREVVGGLTAGAPLERDVTFEDIAAAEETVAFLMEGYEGRGVDEVIADLEGAYEREPTAEGLDELNLLEKVRALGVLKGEFEKIARIEAEQREILEGRLVFVGWTATGSIADFYPTAMGIKTPGVCVHAAVANGILTGHWVARVPRWMDILVTLLAGLSATLVASVLAPSRGWIAALVLTAAYAALNVWIVFDRMDTVLALAGPVVAAVGSWATCTTIRAIQERREKAMVRRQFRARVSAQLVDFLAERPDQLNMEGEERELTIAFTDFVGFTSISEQLEGRQTVAILNRYLRAMTDVLLDHSAYVNKFLGDGIMCFWGAPAIDPKHASKACLSVLDCVNTLEMLNEAPEYEGLPKLGMRVGISTGNVIVGDCGAPPRLNDYTVIGDAVNLAARLESANKLLGTQALVTQRTIDLMDEEDRELILWRPIGKIRVVGQTKPVEIKELVSRRDDPELTDEIREWVKQTERAVELFEAGELAASLEIWQELVLFDRGSAGALAYVERCSELMESERKDFFLPLRSK